MELKKVLRSALTEVLLGLTFKPMAFFITSFRATTDNSLQVEVCQNRRLGGRKRTLLGMVNKSDKRFGSDTTLLFDWLTFKPADLLATFPTLAKVGWTIKDLEAIAATYDPAGDKGREAAVFQALHGVEYIVDVQDGVQLHPVISVTEVTHSALINLEFFKGDDAQEKVENELERGTAVMKTGSDDDADFIVDSESGDKIYRFTRTLMQEDFPKQDWDSMIANKVTESQYQRSSSKAKVQESAFANPDDVKVPSMVGDDKL